MSKMAEIAAREKEAQKEEQQLLAAQAAAANKPLLNSPLPHSTSQIDAPSPLSADSNNNVRSVVSKK